MSSLATCRWKCPKQGRYRTKHMQLCGRTLVCLARSDPSGERDKKGKGREGNRRGAEGKKREGKGISLLRDLARLG